MNTENVIAIGFFTVAVIFVTLLFSQSMYADHLISKAIERGATPQQARCAYGSDRTVSAVCEVIEQVKK
jgi:hypothetical protein